MWVAFNCITISSNKQRKLRKKESGTYIECKGGFDFMRGNYNIHEVGELHEKSAAAKPNTVTPAKRSLHPLIILQDISILGKRK